MCERGINDNETIFIRVCVCVKTMCEREINLYMCVCVYG